MFVKKKVRLILVIFMVILSLFGCMEANENLTPIEEDIFSEAIVDEADEVLGNLKIHFIDVGQGDCIFIQVNDKNILIDGGPNIAEKKVKNYLKNLGIKNINYLIATHPHEDHIGGLDSILKNFKVESVYAPKIITTTTDFKDIIFELNKESKKINIAEKGLTINLDYRSSLNFLSPEDKKYDNLNNYSTVIKLNYGNISFLFTGDSEMLIENELLSSNDNLSAHILKVGHHGSKTSTSKEFLKKVAPKYAVISCGIGNDYGHPDKQVLNSLKLQGIECYRTDKDGTIIIYTNGKDVKISKEKNKKQ